MDPSALTAQDRTRLLALLPPVDPKAVDFYEGRQLGPTPGSTAYWAGPLVPPGHSKYADMQTALLSGFAYRNAVAEVCQRTADAVIGDEPDWGLLPARPLADGEQPSAEEQALIDEAEAALTRLWDRDKVPALLADRGPRIVGFGRTAIRALVPPRYVQDGALQRVASLDDALTRLRFKPADERTSGIIEDPDTLDPIAVCAYQVTDGQGLTHDELEVSYLDEAGNTVLRIVRADASTARTGAPMPLGGRLWLMQASIPRPLITPDLLSQQNALNVALTLLNKNTHFAGFVERYGVGIEQPTDEKGEPVPLNVGPGTANFFQPSAFTESTTDAMGNTTSSMRPASATYGRFEPSDPKALTAAVDYAEANIYAIAHQRFVTMADSATASGRSREVSAGDFLVSAGRLARAVEGLTRDLLEFALAFAGVLMDQPGRYAGLRASVTCRVRGFSPAAADRAQDLAEYSAGAMSLDTLISRRGDADMDAEKARIEAEKQAAPAPTAPQNAPPAVPPKPSPAEQSVNA